MKMSTKHYRLAWQGKETIITCKTCGLEVRHSGGTTKAIRLFEMRHKSCTRKGGE